jgi:hypothetical protein
MGAKQQKVRFFAPKKSTKMEQCALPALASFRSEWYYEV